MVSSELNLALVGFLFSESDLAATDTVYFFVIPIIAVSPCLLDALVLIGTELWLSEI